jgi:cyclophilin family peptidyl-prolyl cis-trans isomerase
MIPVVLVNLELSIQESEKSIRKLNVELELNKLVVPRTVENFIQICKGVDVNGERLSYIGSPLH